jgi:hypothetical protein
MKRVSYHQNLFDLLDQELPLSAEAVRMIEECERRCGRALPAAVREWYSLEGTVHLHPSGEWPDPNEEGSLWHAFSNGDHPRPLAEVLEVFAQAWPPGPEGGFVRIVTENQGCARWYIPADGSDDPPVWCDNDRADVQDWTKEEPFSTFVFGWIAFFGCHRDWGMGSLPEPHRRGHWLHSPREPAVLPPFLDQLIDALEEEPRRVRDGAPTTYPFAAPGARLKVTTDSWDDPEGHSAWWLSADDPKALEALARRVWHMGTLADSMRRFSDESQAVLQRLRAGGVPVDACSAPRYRPLIPPGVHACADCPCSACSCRRCSSRSTRPVRPDQPWRTQPGPRLPGSGASAGSARQTPIGWTPG